jgi:hypothetical protein
MNAIDRVMRAYSRTHTLTDDQTLRVRSELSAFIDALLLGKVGTPQSPVGSSTLDGKL